MNKTGVRIVLVGILFFVAGFWVGQNSIRNQIAGLTAAATVLYEPGAPPSIPLFHGALNVQISALGSSIGPRWVVPAKVKPQFIGTNPGLFYYYFDDSTQKLDGPYVPLPAAGSSQSSQIASPAPLPPMRPQQIAQSAEPNCYQQLATAKAEAGSKLAAPVDEDDCWSQLNVVKAHLSR